MEPWVSYRQIFFHLEKLACLDVIQMMVTSKLLNAHQ